MDLPITPLRQQLEAILHPAPGRCIRIDFDLAERAGLTIVEKRIPAVDEAQNYKCAQFVFRTILAEHQLKSNSGFPHDLFDDPDTFLGKYNYHRVLVPSEGEVLAYVAVGERYVQVKHMGIFKEGKVISKFGIGHIFRHDIGQVPLSYGEKVIFYARDERR